MNKPLRLKDELMPFPTLLINDGTGVKRQCQMIIVTCICDAHDLPLAIVRDYNLAQKIKEALEN